MQCCTIRMCRKYVHTSRSNSIVKVLNMKMQSIGSSPPVRRLRLKKIIKTISGKSISVSSSEYWCDLLNNIIIVCMYKYYILLIRLRRACKKDFTSAIRFKFFFFYDSSKHHCLRRLAFTTTSICTYTHTYTQVTRPNRGDLGRCSVYI